MTRSARVTTLGIAAVLGGFICAGRAEGVRSGPQPDRPNVVILLADDLGYGDLGCYGHPTIRTPNLDRMAGEGLKLTQFYAAAPVCTPSRAALLTGRLPVRVGLTRVLFPCSTTGMPASEVTLAEALQSRGYDTACVGKWHLGHLPQFLPTRHGFGQFLGVPYSNDMVLGGESQALPLPLLDGESVAEARVDPTTLTERYTEASLRFIRAHGRGGPARGTPFFLYVPYTSPHTPLAPGHDRRGLSPRGLYGDAVEEVDASAGAILQAIRDEGLDASTLVVFTSDNGPWLFQGRNGGSAGLLRGGKGSTWEGGMREPCLVWWPGTVRAGRVATDLACTMDWYVTALELAGVKVPDDRPVDGVSLVNLVRGTGASPREVMPFYNGETLAAVRKGPWKLHLSTVESGSVNPLKWRAQTPERPLLYHLEYDPSERFDVAHEHPDVVADLLREAEQVRHGVAAPQRPAQIARAATPPRR